MQTLVDAMERGDVKVGEGLPSERDLAEMLGVGRGSLRECLAVLEFLGAIENRGNRKVVIRNANYIQKVISFVRMSNEPGVKDDFIEFRRVNEAAPGNYGGIYSEIPVPFVCYPAGFAGYARAKASFEWYDQ